METLVVVDQHKNQFCSGSRTHDSSRNRSFGSVPFRGFREISCRTFQAGAGVLPTPLKAFSPVIKRVISPPSSPKSPSPPVVFQSQEHNKYFKKVHKSTAVPIPRHVKVDTNKEVDSIDEFSNSELWAGPAYSNSPPPSSLPMPKFSVLPKRRVSLDLPSTASDLDLPQFAKSAPPSPTRDRHFSTKKLIDSPDSATKTLRRILNLDIADE